MTQSELEVLRVKTLKKVDYYSKSDTSFSTILFMITNFIILVPYFVINYFNDGTLLGGGIWSICFMSFVLYWLAIYETEKENIFWIVEFIICLLAMTISANVPIIGLFYLIYLYVKFYKKINKQELKEREKDYSIEFKQVFKQQYLMPYIEKFGYKYQMYSMIDMAHITNSRLFSRFFKHGGNDKIQGVFEGIKF